MCAHLQDHAEDTTEYLVKLQEAQAEYQVHPVVWNSGKYVSVPPLSPLHLRIGLPDVKPGGRVELLEIDTQQEAPQSLTPQFA
jgi:hypothetical protein